ncbi:calcium/sodium antiporter [Methanobacterium paludis]|uniref:Na+/Ca+ antiporter, CaCA family n=1 Tax=Methanobacterium paludis (strain DSM 25820 / JCM 18151 / SWAN1) TaxID=868131 RepID=F6D521_METPW|nr:calcium/sodium antiporter [Methanobacterium paludis]AEG17556.1 Na+/Ca+ antiporter, CaCA family [Methanobacterium paludis]
MNMVIVYVLALIASLFLVIKTADVFVDNLVEIGEAKGISQIILGVTASAVGTSLPEFGSAIIAILSGTPDIGVGVVIGSNIWNIAGILGISAFVAGVIETNKEELRRDGIMTLITALILMFFMIFMTKLNAAVGIIMIAAYCVYLWFLIKKQKEHSLEQKNNAENAENENLKIEDEVENRDENEIKEGIKKEHNLKRNYIMGLVGIAGLVIGCKIMVWSGVGIAEIMNIPQMIIGLFALAIGTSAPELVVTLSSAMKRLHSLSMGTILGSNIFNILIGIGVPSLFMAIPIERLSVTFDAPVMIFVTSLLLIMASRKKKLTRWAGLVLMLVYIAYITIRIYISV